LSESVTFSIGFQDVASVSEPVQQGPGESFGAKDLGPFLEGQVGGHQEAVMLIGPADHLKEQFGSGLGEGNISEFINDQEMESLELFEQSLESFFFPAFYELSHKVGGGIEANASALGTSGKGQGTDQMGFAGSRVSDQQDVLSFVQILPSQKLPDQCLYLRV
jgi:hypothetical protein